MAELFWIVLIGYAIYQIWSHATQYKNPLGWIAGQTPMECPVCNKKTGFLLETTAFDPIAPPIKALKCLNPKCNMLIKNWEGHENIKDVLDERHEVKRIDLLKVRQQEIEQHRNNAEAKLKASIEKYKQVINKPREKVTINVELEKEEKNDTYCEPDESELLDMFIDRISDEELSEIAEAINERLDEY